MSVTFFSSDLWAPASRETLWLGRVAGTTVVTLAFAVAARFLRGVTWSGAIAGAPISFILYLSAGAGAFFVLVSVFLMTWLATRLGYSQKQRLGTAEKGGGRTASQVLANLTVATVGSLLYALTSDRIFLLAGIAALAEAAADTVSSEYGQAISQPPRLITTWELVPVGTDGAISLSGTVSGITAALIVSLISASLRLFSWPQVTLTTGAATFGMLFDSLLGASLERRHWINNDAVNFLSTLVAAIVAVVAAFAMR